jgi:hypothetical protein
MSAAETTGTLGMDLEHALRRLWEATLTVERAALETIGARREAMASVAAALNETIVQLADLMAVG